MVEPSPTAPDGDSGPRVTEELDRELGLWGAVALGVSTMIAAFYLASFSDWFYRFMYPALGVPAAIPYWVSGLVILGLLVAVNIKGTKETGVFQVVVTVLKVALILVFLYGGLIFLFVGVFSVIFGGTPGATDHTYPFGLHLGIESIAHFADFMLLAGLIVVNLAIVQSRRKHPDVERPFRVPSALGPGRRRGSQPGAAGERGDEEPDPRARRAGRRRALLGRLEVAGGGRGAARGGGPDGGRRSSVAGPGVPDPGPLANPEHADQLVRTAWTLAEDRDGEVLVMSALTIPEQTPLGEGRQYADEKREVLREALDVAEEEGVPASGIIRIAHHASDAILNTIRQHEADAVLMGWRGRPHHRSDVVLGTTVDRVIQEAGCDVLVETFTAEGRPRDAETILVAAAAGPHTDLAVRVAGALARRNDGLVRLLNVVDPELLLAERREVEAATRGQGGAPGGTWSTRSCSWTARTWSTRSSRPPAATT